MGIGSKDLEIFIKLKEGGHLPERSLIIEIGAQQLSNDFLINQIKIEKIGRLFNTRSPAPLSAPRPSRIVHGLLEHQQQDAQHARDFWQWLGLTYAAIDIDGSPCSIPLDLNYDAVPKKEIGKYHLVTNFGTTEHVANQLNAFKVIHDLTAVGGIMMHHLPAQGMLNHGLINYNFKFFWMLARSNGYKWLDADYANEMAYYELPQNIVDCVKLYNPKILAQAKDFISADCSILVVMQKIHATPYVSPLDVPTGSITNNKILKKRYWSIFNKNAFDYPYKYVKTKNSYRYNVLRKIKCQLISLKQKVKRRNVNT